MKRAIIVTCTIEYSCLPGLDYKLECQWYIKEASHGCKRKQEGNICGNGDGFRKVTNLKVPNTSIALVNKSLELKKCQELSLKTFATANINGRNVCITWHGDLVDIKLFQTRARICT